MVKKCPLLSPEVDVVEDIKSVSTVAPPTPSVKKEFQKENVKTLKDINDHIKYLYAPFAYSSDNVEIDRKFKREKGDIDYSMYSISTSNSKNDSLLHAFLLLTCPFFRRLTIEQRNEFVDNFRRKAFFEFLDDEESQTIALGTTQLDKQYAQPLADVYGISIGLYEENMVTFDNVQSKSPTTDKYVFIFKSSQGPYSAIAFSNEKSLTPNPKKFWYDLTDKKIINKVLSYNFRQIPTGMEAEPEKEEQIHSADSNQQLIENTNTSIQRNLEDVLLTSKLVQSSEKIDNIDSKLASAVVDGIKEQIGSDKSIIKIDTLELERDGISNKFISKRNPEVEKDNRLFGVTLTGTFNPDNGRFSFNTQSRYTIQVAGANVQTFSFKLMFVVTTSTKETGGRRKTRKRISKRIHTRKEKSHKK
jgi:hypothetical protein